jgi:hypothetical protein
MYLEADEYAQPIKQCQKAADVGTFASQSTGKLSWFMEKQEDAHETKDDWQNLSRQFGEFDRARPSDFPPQYVKHLLNTLHVANGSAYLFIITTMSPRIL